jgi:hypothetical protein
MTFILADERLAWLAEVSAWYPGVEERGNPAMPKRELVDKLSIYIPQKHQSARVMERLIALGEKRDRSINYLAIEAILEYLERECPCAS